MFKSILVAVDGSDHARRALQIASDLASLYKARLTVMHVVTGNRIGEELKRMAEVEHLIDTPEKSLPGTDNAPANVGYALSDQNLHETIARVATAVGQRILDDAAALVQGSQAEVQTALEHGDPAKKILEYATGENVDLVVVGSRGRSSIEGVVLGSVSTRVSHGASCTCVTVR